MAGWELQLTGSVSHHERELYCTWLAWERLKLYIQSVISTECPFFPHHPKAKNCKSNQRKSGTICTDKWLQQTHIKQPPTHSAEFIVTLRFLLILTQLASLCLGISFITLSS